VLDKEALKWLMSKMAYLFDTDAISELLRPRPLPPYVNWLTTIPREEQYTSAVVVGELYKGAYRSKARQRHLSNIEHRILPAVTSLPYDVATAKVFGQIRAQLEEAGTILADADLQIASTAIYHDLELVSGNLRHFSRIPKLKLNPVLANARS
jgi:predicted nucleic acid-binding protein